MCVKKKKKKKKIFFFFYKHQQIYGLKGKNLPYELCMENGD